MTTRSKCCHESYFLQESSARLNEYRDLATDLTRWMREKTTIMQDRHFPNTLIEMKKLANESVRFRNEEVPPRQRDKQRLQHMYRELQVLWHTPRYGDFRSKMAAHCFGDYVKSWNLTRACDGRVTLC